MGNSFLLHIYRIDTMPARPEKSGRSGIVSILYICIENEFAYSIRNEIKELGIWIFILKSPLRYCKLSLHL